MKRSNEAARLRAYAAKLVPLIHMRERMTPFWRANLDPCIWEYLRGLAAGEPVSAVEERREAIRRQRELLAEPRLKNGLVLLTHNHVAFLHGLLDRPGGVARSRRDLVRAALPYIKKYRQLPSYWTLYHAAYGLSPLWVSRKQVRNRIEFKLLPRGREIIEGKVPGHVRGIGPYVSRRSSERGAA